MTPDSDRPHATRMTPLLGLALGSAVLAVLSYFIWSLVDTIVGMSALLPVVAEDMTITSVPPPSPVASALVFAGAASLLAIAICYGLGGRLRTLWPSSAAAIVGGAFLAWALCALLGARLGTIPPDSIHWAWGFFPRPGDYLPAALVMLVPALAAALGIGLRRLQRASARSQLDRDI